MKVLLIEDDKRMCEDFVKETEKREDITISKITNSSIEALSLIKNYDYDAIIVDLELHFGKGSGFRFLEELKELNLEKHPIIIVNTNVLSEIIYSKIHEGLADMIYYKKQDGYSIKNVIDTLVSIGNIKRNENKEEVEAPKDKTKLYSELINKELDLIGISYKLKGREYMFEGILFMLNSNEKEMTVFQYLSNKYKLLTSSISRAMQTAINEAWRKSPIEDLKEHYTAKISFNTGVPTPTEFLYYYEEKIRKMTKNH